ncbi:TetR family transcriptional regulator C-terminal domain-containing protein [Streptomyces sp. NPDC001508]|uniref:TetR/AcrR family transcriptional regulator n=1 Tax=Streptomyces sp. NPDC001508 TaxID=3154656 RepID=UPI00332C6087
MAASQRAHTPRRASRGKEEILAKAGDVVAERGFERTRFSDVATRTGASISTLQYLFGSREDLVVQALRCRTAQYLNEARRRSAEAEDPLERLRIVAHHLVAQETNADAAQAEWMLWVEYWRTALRDGELAQETADAYEQWLELVRDAIRFAVEAGAVREPADIDQVAQGACAIADGLGVQIALGRPGADWPRAAAITRAWLAAALDCAALAD